jgi:pimeloyl-ACP methyl ester carboxylesterase
MSRNILVIDPTMSLGRQLVAHQLLDTNNIVHCLIQQNSRPGAAELQNEIIGSMTKACEESRVLNQALDLRQRLIIREVDLAKETHQISLRFLDCQVDELWHIAEKNPVAQRHQATLRSLISFSQSANIIINYVRVVAGIVPEESVHLNHEPGKIYNNKEGEDGSEIMNAHQQGGLNFRIFMISSQANEPEPACADYDLYSFLAMLFRFKEEIEDRIPGYFSFHYLNLLLSTTARVNLITADEVVAEICGIAASPETLNQYHHLCGPQTAALDSYLEAIAIVLGIKIRCVSDLEELNPIEELFHLRNGTLDRRRVPANLADQISGRIRRTSDESDLDASRELLLRTFLHDYRESETESFEKAELAILALQKKTINLPETQVLNYYVGGEGPGTIVIINAFGQSLTYWTRLIANLIESHRVIIWLPRGNDDLSGGSGQANPLPVHVEDLRTVLTHEGVESCAFIGWCTGPKLIVEFYDSYPESVSSMVFLCATLKDIHGQQHLETGFESSLGPLLRMVDAMPRLAKPLISSLQTILLSPKTSAGSVAVHDVVARKQTAEMLSFVPASLKSLVIEPFATEGSVINYAKQLVTFWDSDISSRLEKISVPVIFLGGECDGIASTQMAKAAYKLIPRAKYLEIKGGSHYLQYEEYELLTDIVNRFLKERWDFTFDHALVTVNQGNSTVDLLRRVIPELPYAQLPV